MQDEDILGVVSVHRDDIAFLRGPYQENVNDSIQDAYADRGRQAELRDPHYYDEGGIFDIMAITVIQHGLQVAEAA